jgi:phosphatidate cytidylyltransferase
MLRTRLLTALVGIPLFLLAVLMPGGWLFALVLSLLASVGLLEFAQAYRRASRREVGATRWVAPTVAAPSVRVMPNPLLLLWGALLPLLTRFGEGAVLERSLLIALGLACLWELGLAWQRPARAVAYNLGLGLFAALYVGWLMAFGVRLRANDTLLSWGGWQLEQGAAWLLWLMAMLWLGDSMAYFVGRAVGRHRLAPALSPSKSWEGAWANFACCLLVGLGGATWLGLPLWQGGVIGAGVGVLGQLGDLFESSLKRAIGVKDFGGVLPGHGGVLDRFDSFLFSVPWVWWWLGQ